MLSMLSMLRKISRQGTKSYGNHEAGDQCTSRIARQAIATPAHLPQRPWEDMMHLDVRDFPSLKPPTHLEYGLLFRIILRDSAVLPFFSRQTILVLVKS